MKYILVVLFAVHVSLSAAPRIRVELRPMSENAPLSVLWGELGESAESGDHQTCTALFSATQDGTRIEKRETSAILVNGLRIEKSSIDANGIVHVAVQVVEMLGEKNVNGKAYPLISTHDFEFSTAALAAAAMETIVQLKSGPATLSVKLEP